MRTRNLVRRSAAAAALLALVLPGCGPTPPRPEGLAHVQVESWHAVDPGPLNERIDRAVAEGADWPASPLLTAVELLGGDTDARLLLIDEQKNRTEGADTTVVIVVRDGFLDDSVRGEWNRIVLSRGPESAWRVHDARRAFRCYRGSDPEVYASELCP
jgi:hypothetical protein